ncbi:MAG: AlpA family phage regulatory protein [Rhodoferax sp.]|nr:AlpA family phage regulatory protein [Rhodoferax sp.]
MPREALHRLPSVEQLTGLKKSSIYAGMRAGTFPKCLRLGRRYVVWRDSDIQQWIAQRCAESTTS